MAVRYTVLRLLPFFGFLVALWLLQLRGIWLVVAAGLMSAITSYFLLQGPRAELSRKIEARVDRRVKRVDEHRTAEEEEDDEAYDEPSRPDEGDTPR